MATIGTFTQSNNGFAGTVRTLTLNVKVRMVPVEKASENAPDYRIVAAGGYELGAAWKKTTQQGDRPYLSVSLDDPSLSSTIYARLVEAGEGFDLIWTRAKSTV